MASVVKPVWAGRAMRLDPFHLPQAVSYASHDDFGEVMITIGRRGVRMRRVLDRAQIPVTFALPPAAFRGVAARAIEDEDGAVTITLELLHEDPKLSVPLLVAGNLDDVAGDWRAWADAYQLPMLLVEGDGVARTLEESLGQVKTSATHERRQGRAVRKRRPRFLARRKQGSLGLRVIVDGEEIIARR
ncbi:DUF6101 family protein [Chelativorans sp. Marseille-P2723]|uniref:DUF6101 family protein n=1 Tax=Chelativorans sp. Marseille-P2723 TaxID=2709133 RepID=UPI001570E332|nr:DUF6101 family protein [Chelativorans sp. Marseille-P2723]